MTNQLNSKRIAKNTLFLYARMLLTMAVSLYTSRVILQVLGIEDFGVYNVVGGIVSMFAFINGGMVSATQRYITYEIGTGDLTKLKRVFSTSLQIHAIISLLIILLGETVGLWFLIDKMVIPPSRATAAMWVYQCSVFACVVNIMSIPYNADIVAHEKMSAFAYISIIEVVLKLLIVYLLILLPYDKLIVYAILILLVQVFIRLIYTRYCRRRFEESAYNHSFNSTLFKEMASFAGWSFWGNLSSVLYTQGLNIMLNLFFGPVVNAARGIAVQVQSAVQQFVTNFQMALNPQITKSYAAGEIKQMHILMFRSARFSFALLFFVTLPLLLETNFILTKWLKYVPDNAVIFTRLMICISLIFTTANPCAIANQATGNVKKFQLVEGCILMTILPISFVALKSGLPAYSVFIVHFCVELFAQFFRMLLLENQINLRVIEYFKNIYFPISVMAVTSFVLPVVVHELLEEGWGRFLFVSSVCMCSVGLSATFTCLTKRERSFLFDKLMTVIGINNTN